MGFRSPEPVTGIGFSNVDETGIVPFTGIVMMLLLLLEGETFKSIVVLKDSVILFFKEIET